MYTRQDLGGRWIKLEIGAKTGPMRRVAMICALLQGEVFGVPVLGVPARPQNG